METSGMSFRAHSCWVLSLFVAMSFLLAASAGAVCPGGWQQLSGSGPGDRIGFGLAYDSVRDRVVLFGGTTGNDELGDTWEWDGNSWTKVATTGPAPRWGACMTYDSVNAC